MSTFDPKFRRQRQPALPGTPSVVPASGLPDTAAGRQASAPPGGAATRTILIIEDDAVVAGIYRSKFERAGYVAEVSLDGQAGFYRVMELNPNVLLLDLMLPNINGLEILKKVRAQQKFERMTVLVLTNYFLGEVALEADRAGATEVFDKATATPEQLLASANRALFLRLPQGSQAAPASAPAPATPVPERADRNALETTHPNQKRGPETRPPRPAAMRAGQDSVFFESAPQYLAQLRSHFQLLARATATADRLEALGLLARKIHSITSHAAAEELPNIARFASALGALLESLRLIPENINASTTATVAGSIDFLGELFQRGGALALDSTRPVNILVVDDEEVPRRNIVRALSTVKLSAVTTGSPEEALKLLSEKPFDLIFLDVEMPGMTGFDLCARLRKLPLHAKTPVVFVTALSGFEARLRSTMSGGNEFIAKPFLIIELAAKALKHVMRQQI